MGNNIFDWDDEDEKPQFEQPAAPAPLYQDPVNAWKNPQWNDPWETAADAPAENQKPSEEPVVEYLPYEPETPGESARRGGLAWSAGIVFFSSIVFMLFLGWGFDLIFRSSPWGIIGGIVLGSIIGFIQFFRISSQIFNSAKAEAAMRPLLPRDDNENKY